MTPLASVAILEKFALLNIARCRVGAMSGLSRRGLTGITGALPKSTFEMRVFFNLSI